MAHFPGAVREAQATLAEQLDGLGAPGDIVSAFRRPRLVHDAEAVDDIVSRFSRAELDGRAVGRYGGVKFFPALGELIGKRLERVDRDAVRGAVAKAVGVGYVFLGAIEEEDAPIPDREPREMWNVWAPGLNTGLIEQTALPPDMVRDMRQAGASIFQADALHLGLGGFRKKARLGHVGAYYSQAGAILRAVQAHPQQLRPDPASLWRYEDYPP